MCCRKKNLYHHPQFQFMSALLDALGLLAASKRTFIQFSTEHHCQSTRLTNVMTHWTKYWVSFKRFSRIVVKVVVIALKDTQKDGKLQLCKFWIKDTQNRQQHYGLKINRSPNSCNIPRFYSCFFRIVRKFIQAHENSPIWWILNSSVLRLSYLLFSSPVRFQRLTVLWYAYAVLQVLHNCSHVWASSIFFQMQIEMQYNMLVAKGKINTFVQWT